MPLDGNVGSSIGAVHCCGTRREPGGVRPGGLRDCSGLVSMRAHRACCTGEKRRNESFVNHRLFSVLSSSTIPCRSNGLLQCVNTLLRVCSSSSLPVRGGSAPTVQRKCFQLYVNLAGTNLELKACVVQCCVYTRFSRRDFCFLPRGAALHPAEPTLPAPPLPEEQQCFSGV